MANTWGNSGNSDRLYFLGVPYFFSASLQMVTAAIKLKDTCSLGKKAMKKLDSILKDFANKSPYSQNCFSKSHVWM